MSCIRKLFILTKIPWSFNTTSASSRHEKTSIFHIKDRGITLVSKRYANVTNVSKTLNFDIKMILKPAICCRSSQDASIDISYAYGQMHSYVTKDNWRVKALIFWKFLSRLSFIQILDDISGSTKNRKWHFRIPTKIAKIAKMKIFPNLIAGVGTNFDFRIFWEISTCKNFPSQ